MNITVHISQSQVTESLVNTRVNCLLDVVFVVIFFFFLLLKCDSFLVQLQMKSMLPFVLVPNILLMKNVEMKT